VGFYEITRDRSAYDSYVVLRGTFASGATAAWATRYVKTATGLLDGRMEIEPVGGSLPETAGGEPERANVTVRIHDHDNAVTKWVRGTATSPASTEYKDDGFLNFTGKLYLGVRDPATGTMYEREISPTVCLNGSPTYDGFTATLPLASYDDRVIGKSQIPFTVRDLKVSAHGSAGDGSDNTRKTTGILTQGEFDNLAASIGDNLDEQVRYLYGHQIVPMQKVGEHASSSKAKIGSYFYVLFATVTQPLLDGFSGATGGGLSGWPIFVGDRGTVLQEIGPGDRVGFVDAPHVHVLAIQRSITNQQGKTFEAWVTMVQFDGAAAESGQKLSNQKLFVDPRPQQGVVAASVPPPPKAGVADIIKAIVRDHSVEGLSGIDTTSFSDAAGGTGVGVLYDGTEPIFAPLGKIASAAGLSLWPGLDDLLHVKRTGAITPTDTATIAAGGLPHITAADILGDWEEELPYNPGQRGAPAKRVVIRWTRDQEAFWASDAVGHLLLQEAPGILPSFPDLAESIEAEVPGDAIYPPQALALLTDVASRQGSPRRRIKATCRAWLATMEKGTLFWLSHPRGLGDNVGGGYSMRVVRLESTDFTWSEDGCRCVFEDLGPVANWKLGYLTTITDWQATPPTAGDTLTLTAGSRAVALGAGNVRKFVAGDVGRSLWTNGAGVDGNRSSKRITRVNSTTSADVDASDAVYASNETIVAAGTGYDCTWQILDNQETKGSSYKPDRIRECAEATGLLRDGVTAGFQY
jgi:hypothetical protein